MTTKDDMDHANVPDPWALEGLPTDPPKPADAQPPSNTESKLAAAGVFKGAEGLRGLAQANEFWEKQPYGTRLYYGEGGLQYLHRSILETAVQILDKPDQSAEIKRLLERESTLLAEVERLQRERNAMALNLQVTEHKYDQVYEAREIAEAHADRLVVERDEARAQVERYRNAFGLDQPWPLHDVLAKLIEATEHLLNHHACNRHGHEEFRTAENAGKSYLGFLRDADAIRTIEPGNDHA